MKYLAVQTGARRGYAVPAILEQAGMLERFYTDATGSTGLGAVAGAFRWLPGLRTPLSRLHARQLPPAVRPKCRTFAAPALRRGWDEWRAGRDTDARFHAGHRYSRRWGAAMIRAGFGGATHLFSMLCEGGPLLAAAKQRGLVVVSEVYILLSTERIVAREHEAFPAWEPAAPDYAALRAKFDDNALLAHTDYFICPSTAVRDDLVAHWGVDAARTALVPYGMDPKWLELEPQPTPRRILFVGTAELRKGIHYLAMSAERLRAAGRDYEFRVAGHVTPQVAQQPACRSLTFLGRVPRAAIHAEFQQADVFVLPSLAEGSAEVTYEALGAGVPLVTTPASGSIISDGIEGRLVPERDAAALADAIEGIVENRAERTRMATAARALARDYTWDRYGERLVAALRGFEELRLRALSS